MFTLRAEVPDWPFPGPGHHKTVRFFEKHGHFIARQTGTQWRIVDDRRSNERGGPDNGVTFATQAEAEAFVLADGPR